MYIFIRFAGFAEKIIEIRIGKLTSNIDIASFEVTPNEWLKLLG